LSRAEQSVALFYRLAPRSSLFALHAQHSAVADSVAVTSAPVKTQYDQPLHAEQEAGVKPGGLPSWLALHEQAHQRSAGPAPPEPRMSSCKNSAHAAQPVSAAGGGAA